MDLLVQAEKTEGGYHQSATSSNEQTLQDFKADICLDICQSTHDKETSVKFCGLRWRKTYFFSAGSSLLHIELMRHWKSPKLACRISTDNGTHCKFSHYSWGATNCTAVMLSSLPSWQMLIRGGGIKSWNDYSFLFLHKHSNLKAVPFRAVTWI